MTKVTALHRSLIEDVTAVQSIAAVSTLLELIRQTTGMGFAAVARVSDTHWVACSVSDGMDFGLVPGGQLELSTTLCAEVRECGEPIVINSVSDNALYADHHTPKLYGFQSYISQPIRLTDGSFFGTLCALDPKPRLLTSELVLSMFKAYADIIGFHLSDIARSRVERVDAERREQVIAVIGHDLRTPLAAIRAAAGALLRESLTVQASRLAGLIDHSSARMAELVSNLMDLAQGQFAGGIALRGVVPTIIADVMHRIVAEVQSTAPLNHIIVDCEVTDPIPCDPARIGQMLANLLTNAVTYGDTETPIRVSARILSDVFYLSVTNSGRPIDDAAQQRIFLPYVRNVEPDMTQGLGLGLYICREIARAHGGRMQVKSDEVGTVFTFSMPLVACPPVKTD